MHKALREYLDSLPADDPERILREHIDNLEAEGYTQKEIEDMLFGEFENCIKQTLEEFVVRGEIDPPPDFSFPKDKLN